MKHFICASLTALVFALPLYAQTSSPSGSTPSMGTDPSMGQGTTDSQMQQEPSSSGSHRVHKKSKEVEMQEETTPMGGTGSSPSSVPSDSSMSTDEMDSEE